MASAKLLNLIVLSSLAILACSFGDTPVNAVSVDKSHFAPSPPPGIAPRSNSSGDGGKIGIAWALGDDPALQNFKTDKVGPIYTWSPFIPQQARSLGFDPVPMLWGDKQIADFSRLVVQGYASTVLGFNEPNQQGQADMSPQHAADVWRQYIDPLKNQGYRLISPATTSAPSGKQWMKDFFVACSGCHFDGLALHWYGTSPTEFIKYITDFHLTFGYPIWVTEFGCQIFSGGAQCTHDEVFNLMTTVKDFMDNTSWVVHYFAFGILRGTGGANSLMDSNGFPTELGNLYLN